MQNASNRSSLDMVLNRSLKENNFAKGTYIGQNSSFRYVSNSEMSQMHHKKNNGKRDGAKTPTLQSSCMPHKGSKATTFYKLLSENGFIRESLNLTKPRKREWEVQKVKNNVDSDGDEISD